MRIDPKHLLDTKADQNIGNGSIIQPQQGSATIIPQTNPERILMLSGPSSTGQTTSVALTASRIVGPQNPNPGFPGPIVGVVEFGNGGQFTRVEVDIPIGPFSGDLSQPAPATEPQDGGVIITVPTGVLRIYARYDNLLIQPMLGVPPISLAQSNGVPFLGPGGPVSVRYPFVGLVVTPSEPVLVKAMAAFFSRHTSKVYRTHYLYVGDQSSGLGQTAIPINGTFCVPPFARSLKVLRQPQTSAFTLTLRDNSNNLLETYSIPAGSPSPTILTEGTETIVGIASVTPADVASFLAVCYEIGI